MVSTLIPDVEDDNVAVRISKKGRRWMKFAQDNFFDAGDCVDPESEGYKAFHKAEAKRLSRKNLGGKIKKPKKKKETLGFHHPQI